MLDKKKTGSDEEMKKLLRDNSEKGKWTLY